MKSTDPQFPLSKDFKLFEFTTSQTATRLGISNQPTNDIVVKLKRLVTEVIQPARDALGPIRISSGYRSPALNRAVGGSRSSEHMLGQAADLIPLACSKQTLYNWILKNCEFNQLIREFPNRQGEPAWIHVSYSKGRNKKQAFTIS